MAYEMLTQKQDVTAVDIHTMRNMSSAEYEDYLGNLVYLDHHEVLRSMPAGYPLAVTEEQAKAFVRYIQELVPRVGER